LRLEPEKIKEVLGRIPDSALGSAFFDDIEAFRSIMEYFRYGEESLEGYKSDKTYLTTFYRAMTLRITIQGEKMEDQVFINLYRAGQYGYICGIGDEVPEAVRKEILQACRLSRRKVLDTL
jgi:hypothetical protein